MTKLENITKGTHLKGIVTNNSVEVIDVAWHGTDVIEITFKEPNGNVNNEVLYRDSEPDLEIAIESAPYSFNADSSMFKLVSEAYRIRLAYIFDPMMAIHTSMIEPLPHQITAVYDSMLPRQPLRFLLADDPGAGKTIMAGLLIKELVIRGDVKRCMIVCPGVLAEQWQDELYQKFQLPFEILTNDKINASKTGNWFTEENLVISRIDKLARDEDLKDKLNVTDWDLIIVDEAHKMSASFFGGEVKYTKRFRLGQLLSRKTRHFLLMTATPHNGKEEDFQLFLSLLDGDRFEGRFRDGVHTVEVSDIMRRLLKEELVKFDGKPLFPERIALTVPYQLSALEEQLYTEVSTYVREQFNRADRLESGRRGTVGFALTILQRRLASSPEAIYQSIRRRKERLESRLEEERMFQRVELSSEQMPEFESEDELEDYVDEFENEDEESDGKDFVDRATTAQTIQELQAEINTLKSLEELALSVKRSGNDKKWEELSNILTESKWMFDEGGNRRKLVIFTEHRDTLTYLATRIRALLGSQDTVVTIQGGMNREDRRKAQEQFTQDIHVSVLIATDAAGEGINLQRAHLMVNYDLPWNPNRLEQRFGRIHRIGQTEVCRLWNLIAHQTREGEVWQRLFEKLEVERASLGGQVFDVLGEMTFENKSLRDLLIEAIRYGNDPERKAYLDRVLNDSLDHEKIQKILQERSLHSITMTRSNVKEIREEMDRAAARKLQPHFIADFFLSAFKSLGGSISEKEKGRYQVMHVPAAIRNRDSVIGTREPILKNYERITFHKELISVQGKPLAAFVCPGHPLLDATIDLLLESRFSLLKQGSILIDELNPSSKPRVLFYLENSVQDAKHLDSGGRRTISKEVHFVELWEDGNITQAGYAPYLDYKNATDQELNELIPKAESLGWLKDSMADKIKSFAITSIARDHLKRIKTNREYLIEKTRDAVEERLTNEIRYWDHRARDLRHQEEAGKANAKLNSNEARKRADELQARLQKRLEELDQECKISSKPPVIIGASLVLPASWITGAKDETYKEQGFASPEEKAKIEAAGMQAVFQIEAALGNKAKDRSHEKIGYDIESIDGKDGNLRFIEVKGRRYDAPTVTITKNEIIHGLNLPEQFILAICLINGKKADVHFIKDAFTFEPDFGVTSINFNIKDLLTKAVMNLQIELEQ
ncbi:helicase-related protein [Cyclobacterium jeungdonense]|uniref:Helicase-related protein n=1 Tax=Cyclobacterium jeungdonense TaxID=708087 RepID=A0ABT8C6I6_9BACT|nr:helicase-related protein [Cyclobacterium jeungdonense]MDN3687238.1 helicase-related protein [Cyclobacterium jeungdonense]